MTESRNVDVVFARYFQDGLAAASADLMPIDFERFDFERCFCHASTSAGSGSAAGVPTMLQTPAGQRLCRMCSRYSFLKYFSVLSTGFGAVCPRPHRLVSFTVSQSSISSSRSSMVPVPAQIRVRSVCICAVPARHGMHLPHDSVMQNSMKNRATLTMQDVSSMTIMPPEPIIAPTLSRES